MKNIFLILMMILFTGCTLKVQSEKMILDSSYKQITQESVNVVVNGDNGMYFPGKGIDLNNAHMLDREQILDAVIKNIQKSAIFGSVKPDGTYRLDIFIINALSDEGVFSMTGKIKLEMAWNLSKNNQTIWRNVIISNGQNRAFNGYERIVGTYNNAVKDNIDKALSQISELNLK